MCHCFRLILPKVWVDRFTGPQPEIDIRYEFDLVLLRKGLGSNRDYCGLFQWLSKQKVNLSFFFIRLIFRKVWFDGFTEPRRETDVRYEFGFKVILKGLNCKQRLLQPFSIKFPSNK